MPLMTKDINTLIGKKLRQKREELGLTQRQVASNLDVTFQQLQKYEKGTNQVSAGKLIALSKLFKVPVSYFYNTKGTMVAGFAENQEGYSSKKDKTDKDLEKLAKCFKSIKDDQVKEQVLKLVKSLAKNQVSL